MQGSSTHLAQLFPGKVGLTCLLQHLCPFLCFGLCECCLLDFYEHFLSFTCILACTSTFLVFVSISLLLHAWMIVDSKTHFTHMHDVSFFESSIHCLRARSFTPAHTQYHHAFTITFAFIFPTAGPGSLGPDPAIPR